MAKNDYNKEVKKLTEKIRTIKAEMHFVSKVQAAFILLFAAVILGGMSVNLLSDSEIVKGVGFMIMFAAIFAVLVTYIILRARGPLNCTTYFFTLDGGESGLLQVLGKNHFYFSYRGITLQCRNGNVERAATPFYPQVAWDWFTSVDFTDKMSIDASTVKYKGRFGKEKFLLQFKDSKLYYAEKGGLRLHYYEQNEPHKPVAIPTSLYSAATKIGVTLPGFIKSL